jgi:long-chain fatty acid transport protein
MYRLLGKLLVIICAIVTVQTIAYANFADTYGFSAMGISRGNAMTAVVNDWSSVYYNIAGLGKTHGYVEPAQQEQKELTLKQKGGKENVEGEPTIGPYDLFPYKDQLAINYMYTQPQMTIDIPRTDIVADKELNFGTVTLGLVLDLNHFIKMPSFISSSRFGLGLGLMQDGSLVKVYDIDLRTHDFVRYGKEAERAVILAGMGFGFLDDLFGIGVGANVWTGGSGAVQLSDVEVGPNPQTPNQEIQMELTPKIAPIAGLYISPGKKIHALRGLELGVAYRGEVYMEVDPFSTTAELYLLGVNLQMALSIFDYYTPQILSGGIAYTFLPVKPLSGLTLSVDVEYQMWSKHRVSKAKETYWAKNGVTIPKFQDIIVPKAGLSYNFGCLSPKMQWLTLNLGYSYRPTFVPDEADTSVFNFLDCNTHIGSAGLVFTIPKIGPMVAPIVITIAGQMQMLQERQVKKDVSQVIAIYQSIDSNWTPEQILAENPSEYTYGGTVYSGFVEVALRW